jgi:hypothetical protein
MYLLAIDGIDPNNLSIGETLLIALVCIIIVFLMLALLWGIVSLFRFLPKPKEKVVEEKTTPVKSLERKPISVEDIKDEDMMVAALVASIEYRNEVKEDVRVVSIKEL